jgi:serine/threonine protein phosphatase PrpC
MQIECDNKKQYSGTTALGCFIVGSTLLVFSIGDCQAVLCSNGTAVSVVFVLLFSFSGIGS